MAKVTRAKSETEIRAEARKADLLAWCKAAGIEPSLQSLPSFAVRFYVEGRPPQEVKAMIAAGGPFMFLVKEYKAAHVCTMQKALGAIAKTHPELHADYLAAAQPKRR